MSGTVYGIGVGPGDPELLTLKALRLIRACPVLAYPALEAGDSLARRIFAPHMGRPQPLEYSIRLPITPDPAPARRLHDENASQPRRRLAGRPSRALPCPGD